MFKSLNQVFGSVWDEAANALRILASASGALTDASGDIDAPATSQQVLAAKPGRKYLLVVNISDTDMWLAFGGAAVADQPSIPVKAGGSFVMEGSFISNETVNLICATAGKKYVAKEA